MKEAKQMKMTGISFHNVPTDSVKVYINDHDGFSAVIICIGSSSINLFVDNSTEASALVEALTTTTRVNYRSETTV